NKITDLRNHLKRKAAIAYPDSTENSMEADLSEPTDLRIKLNANAEALSVRLNRDQPTDRRQTLRRTQACRTSSESDDEPCDLRPKSQRSKHLRRPTEANSEPVNDLRVQIRSRQNRLNVIMGGSPPCGNSVRSIKNYRRQAITSQKWPSR